MSYVLKEHWLSASKYNLKSPYTMKAIYIAIHETGNNASAMNEASYMVGNDSEVGFHVVVDNVDVVQCIPFNRNAWHAGDGENGKFNRNAIGIEICYQTGSYELYKASVDNAVQYVATLMNKYELKATALFRHMDANGKDCPNGINHGRYIDWREFVNRVILAMGNDGGTDPNPPIEKPFPKNLIGMKVDDEIIQDAYMEESWYVFDKNNKNPVYPTLLDAMKNQNAFDFTLSNNGGAGKNDEIYYMTVIRSNKFDYLLYKGDNGQDRIVAIRNKLTNWVAGYSK